ncbi:hypothetical protein BOX15_Mlig034597g2, partial [Macrostomum lignano]
YAGRLPIGKNVLKPQSRPKHPSCAKIILKNCELCSSLKEFGLLCNCFGRNLKELLEDAPTVDPAAGCRTAGYRTRLLRFWRRRCRSAGRRLRLCRRRQPPRAGPLQERLPLLQAAPSPVGRRGVQHRSGLCGGRDGSCSCGQGWAALREGPRLPASDGQRAAAVNSQRSYRSLLLKTIFRTELLIIRNIDFDFC